MDTEPLVRLAFTVTLSTLYAVGLSVGYGKKLDEWGVTRPLVVAGGVLIVMGGYTWGDWGRFADILLWFTLAAIPQILRVAIMFVQEQERNRLEAYQIDHDKSA